ncbi:Hypothetical protein A7982_09186 [Minicystis rosea]|nr:Hypothetical protein A7982_09186 [Minicystis rosea]
MHLDAARIAPDPCGVRPRRSDAAADTPERDSHVPASLDCAVHPPRRRDGDLCEGYAGPYSPQNDGPSRMIRSGIDRSR